MALGIRRSRFGIDATRLFSVRALAPADPAKSTWMRERGQVLVETHADISGGFPGYADLGALLSGIHLRVTTTHLTVDEHQPWGFGLPLDWIDGLAPLAADSPESPLLVRYHDGVNARALQVRVRPGRFGAHLGRQATRVHAALAGAEIPLIDLPASPLQAFTLPWEETSTFEREEVIWNGAAAAPLQLGDGLVASEVWLTTKSLIWGSGAGAGINRIPCESLCDLVSTRLRDRIGTPAIYLAVDCAPLGRFDVPFIFNRLSPPDHNFRERAGMLDGLRALAIGDGEAVPYWQPWRSPRPAFTGVTGEWQPATTEDAPVEDPQIRASVDHDDEHRANDFTSSDGNSAASMISVPEPAAADGEGVYTAPGKSNDSSDQRPSTPCANPDPQPAPAEDLLLAVWTAPANPPAPQTDTAIAHGWVERTAPEPDIAAEDTWPVAAAAALPPMTEPVTLAPVDPWVTIRRYEASALDALDELLHAIDRRAAGRNPIELVQPPPSSREQARALADLAELRANGTMVQTDAARRRERILALGDICVRLRTVIELHASGHLTDAELGLKRKRLIDGLSISLVRM